MIKKLTCDNWSEVPYWLKTKTSLNRMGIFSLAKPYAIVEIYGKEYKLYSVHACLKIEQSRGNKNIVINSQTKEHYLISEIETTGSGENDRITRLLIIDLDGKVLFDRKFKSDNEWSRRWNTIAELIEDKILFIPNTIYFKRLVKQSCKRCNIDLDFKINAICSSQHIQHKLSILRILNKEQETIQADITKSCYQFLETIYSYSKIFYLRKKALVYFNKLCEYKTKQGDINGKIKGEQWLKNDYGSSNFSDFSYETSEEIIELIYPILKGLGCLPRKF